MTDSEKFFDKVLKDLKVELTDEFDKNFERKAFFDKAWPETKKTMRKGTLLMRTGALRKSIKSEINGQSINFKSSLIYAQLHNEGGTITVTAKVKKFFWAMYYQAMGGMGKKKDGTASKTKKNAALTVEATYWKNMALMKIGSKITIPQRQFIGYHPQVDRSVKMVVDENVKNLETAIHAMLQAAGNGVKNFDLKKM